MMEMGKAKEMKKEMDKRMAKMEKVIMKGEKGKEKKQMKVKVEANKNKTNSKHHK